MRWVPAILALLLATVGGCAVLFPERHGSEPPDASTGVPPRAAEPDAATSRPEDAGAASAPSDAAGGGDVGPRPREERCPRVCRHILRVSAPDRSPDDAAGWLERCERACIRHASQGQLDCYERAERPSALEACTVR